MAPRTRSISSGKLHESGLRDVAALEPEAPVGASVESAAAVASCDGWDVAESDVSRGTQNTSEAARIAATITQEDLLMKDNDAASLSVHLCRAAS